MKVQQAKVFEKPCLLQCLHCLEHFGEVEPELGPCSDGASPAAGAAARQFRADADERRGPKVMTGGNNPLDLVRLFDHHHRLVPESTRQDCRLDVTAILVTVADQQSVRIAGQ